MCTYGSFNAFLLCWTRKLAKKYFSYSSTSSSSSLDSRRKTKKSDHGFPSTHTISFVASPIYLLIYQYYDKFYRISSYPISFSVASFLLFWSASSVIFSRMYNGYHSPLDVFGGSVIGLSIVGIWYNFIRNWFDLLLMWKSIYAPITSFMVSIFMIIFHPRPPEPTAALPESGMLFGTAAGATIGVQLNTLFDMQSILGPTHEDRAMFFRNAWLLQISRFIVGMVIVILLRTVGKLLFTKLVKKFYPDEKDNNWVLTLVKYLNYFSISFAILFWIQIVFHQLGLHTDYDLRPVGLFPTGYPK